MNDKEETPRFFVWSNPGRIGMNTTIREFTVWTCGKKLKVEARSPWLAAISAIKTKRFKSIGVLIQVTDPKGTEFFISGIRAAKAAGLLADGVK